MFEQSIRRAAHVQYHRQAKLARQLELRAVDIFLAFAQGALCQFRYKVIQSDLAHRHEARVGVVGLQMGGQCKQVVGASTRAA